MGGGIERIEPGHGRLIEITGDPGLGLAQVGCLANVGVGAEEWVGFAFKTTARNFLKPDAP